MLKMNALDRSYDSALGRRDKKMGRKNSWWVGGGGVLLACIMVIVTHLGHAVAASPSTLET